MAVASAGIGITRHAAFLPPFRLHVECYRNIAISSNQQQQQQQQPKDWARLRTGDTKGKFKSWKLQNRGVETPGALQEGLELGIDQAVGKVTGSHANFLTVIVDRIADGPGFIDDSDNSRKGAVGHEGMQNGGFLKHAENCSRTGTRLLCTVRALMKKMRRRVLVGDRVLVSGISWEASSGVVDGVFERKSEIFDPPVANVDHLLLFFSLDRPRLDEMVLSRFLVEAESTNVPFTIVLNKADIVSKEVIESWDERLSNWGYKPCICSVNSRSGLELLVPLLENRTSVVMGPSGVGKSSLIRALRRWSDVIGTEVPGTMDQAFRLPKPSDEDRGLRVAEVSVRSGFGRHTTRNVSLVQLPIKGAFLADTPGFSYPDLLKVSRSSLALLFPEVVARQEKSERGCTFANCEHVEEPGCCVGGDWERYPHYLALLDEVRKREEQDKKVFGTKQESEIRYKNKESGIKQAEPRLLMKKHRRTSRRVINQSLDNELFEAEEAENI